MVFQLSPKLVGSASTIASSVMTMNDSVVRDMIDVKQGDDNVQLDRGMFECLGLIYTHTRSFRIIYRMYTVEMKTYS